MRKIGYAAGILALAGLLAMTGCEIDEGSTIQGNVLGVRAPARAAGVAGVTVSLEGTDFVTTTDENGEFEITDVPEGEYVLVISLGDAKGTYPIKIDDGVVVRLENISVADDGSVTVEKVTVTEVDDDSEDDDSVDDDSVDDGESLDDDESLDDGESGEDDDSSDDGDSEGDDDNDDDGESEED